MPRLDFVVSPLQAPMSSELFSIPVSVTDPTTDSEALAESGPDPRQQIRLKSSEGRLILTLPPQPSEPETGVGAWPELLQQVKQRLESAERFWQPDTQVSLMAQDRLLDVRQLQDLTAILSAAQLALKWVLTSRRQTALAAITAGYSVEQLADLDHLVQTPKLPGRPLDEPLYLQTTVRSGVEIRHPGTIVILGDANPGSSLIAEGDILVWGRLRGTAQAGSAGNRSCRIMALQMQPTQLRIAELVARLPDTPPADYGPEVAYIGGGVIRIALANDFARQQRQGLTLPQSGSQP